MDMQGKACPHCQMQLQHGGATFELQRRQASGLEGRSPLPVIPYWCPRCGYLQLYAARVAASLYG